MKNVPTNNFLTGSQWRHNRISEHRKQNMHSRSKCSTSQHHSSRSQASFRSPPSSSEWACFNMRRPHLHTLHHHLLLLLITLNQLLCLSSGHFCSNRCELVYNEAFSCDSDLAFIAKDANVDEIESIIANSAYLCLSTNTKHAADTATDNSANTNNGVQQRDDWDASTFELSSYVLLWQAMVISLIMPSLAVMLFRVLRAVFVRVFESVRCRENSRCGCCLYLVSAEYRQQRRNRQFDREVYDDKKSEENGWWRFDANRHRASVEGDHERKQEEEEDVREYQHVPLNEEEVEQQREQQIVPEVLEEVSIERGELDKYLDVPGSGAAGQGIELSFSSHGLRQICDREIV